MAVSDSNDPPVRPSWETARPQPSPAQRPAPAPTRFAAPAAVSAPPAAVPPPAPPAPAYSETPDLGVKYDLAGNPIPGTGMSASAGPLPGAVVYSAGTAAGAWPPAPTSPYSSGTQIGENGTDRVARLKWNWGAFLIPFWWSIFNGQRGIAVAIFLINALNRVIPAPYDWGLTVASLGIGVYLGAMGHRLAWTSDRFGGDYDYYIRTQRAWMIWGFVFAGLGFGAIIAFAVLVPGVFGSLTGTPAGLHHYGSYSNSSSNGDGSGSSSTPAN